MEHWQVFGAHHPWFESWQALTSWQRVGWSAWLALLLLTPSWWFSRWLQHRMQRAWKHPFLAGTQAAQDMGRFAVSVGMMLALMGIWMGLSQAPAPALLHHPMDLLEGQWSLTERAWQPVPMSDVLAGSLTILSIFWFFLGRWIVQITESNLRPRLYGLRRERQSWKAMRQHWRTLTERHEWHLRKDVRIGRRENVDAVISQKDHVGRRNPVLAVEVKSGQGWKVQDGRLMRKGRSQERIERQLIRQMKHLGCSVALYVPDQKLPEQTISSITVGTHKAYLLGGDIGDLFRIAKRRRRKTGKKGKTPK